MVAYCRALYEVSQMFWSTIAVFVGFVQMFYSLYTGSYKCQCGENYKLGADRSCKYIGDAEYPVPYLVFSDRYNLRKLSLNGKSYESLVSELINVVAVDFDYKEGLIFWSTNSPKGIKSAKLDGTDIKSVIKLSQSSADGMAVDWVGRNLYFCEAYEGAIYVSRLNGYHMKQIVSGLKEPRGMAVYPQEGKRVIRGKSIMILGQFTRCSGNLCNVYKMSGRSISVC